MSDSIRYACLHQSELLNVTDACCRPRECGHSSEEHSTATTLVFARRGLFVRHVGRTQTVADPNGVIFFRQGEIHRVSHPVEGGDDCTSLRFSPAILAEAFGGDRALDSAVADPLPQAASLPLDPRTLLGVHRLRRVLAFRNARRNPEAPDKRARASDLSVEEAGLAILNDVANRANQLEGSRAGSTRRQRADTTQAHHEISIRVRIVLAKRLAEQTPLCEIARRVQCSPFHLARVFREQTGLSLHGCLMRLRLAAALERLADGERDLTQLALSVGFSSHAHFTQAFRQIFSTTPSTFCRELSTRMLRQMSTNLKA